jgi:hypothetical protein
MPIIAEERNLLEREKIRGARRARPTQLATRPISRVRVVGIHSTLSAKSTDPFIDPKRIAATWREFTECAGCGGVPILTAAGRSFRRTRPQVKGPVDGASLMAGWHR